MANSAAIKTLQQVKGRLIIFGFVLMNMTTAFVHTAPRLIY